MKSLLCGCLLIVCISCNKITDIVKDFTSGSSSCRIHTVTDSIISPADTIIRIATCNYNAHGDPISVTYNRRETGFGWSFLTYDQRNRLIGLVSENNAIHSYVYEGNAKQPTWDTVTSVNTATTFIERFTYDQRGRIVKVSGKFLRSEGGDVYPDYEQQYSYNEQGNLKGSFDYDNKVSVYSTHPVWMFIHRNYSVNNIVRAISYNNKGLPLHFTGGLGTAYFFEGSFNAARVEYDCR